jgi:hypothetical protein
MLDVEFHHRRVILLSRAVKKRVTIFLNDVVEACSCVDQFVSFREIVFGKRVPK